MNEYYLTKIAKVCQLYSVAIEQSHARIVLLEQENERLNQRLQELVQAQLHQQFGKKSEASQTALDLSSALSTPTAVTALDAPAQTTAVAAHTRVIPARGTREFRKNDLPKYTVTHDLPDEQKKCACCGLALHLIQQEKSEKLEIIPVQYCIVEHIRFKYGCRTCQTMVMAPKEQDPFPKAIAGTSLITDVILNKYQYHLPLYRQAKIMASQMIEVSDKTLANWVIAAGDALGKIYDAMWLMLQHRYLQVDETPVKVLQNNKQGYVWAYFAPNGGKGVVVFEFSLTRQGAVAEERLKTFKGLLQTDGYAGYKALRARQGIVAFGCLTHARRKFSEVVKISSDKTGIAAEMIERLKPLYVLEARLREINAPHRIRKLLRRKIAQPILKKIQHWLRAIQKDVLPKSKLGNAITYTLNQWQYLIAYVNHGMAEIDTNAIENKIRTIALGKKNWLFMGNEDCGKIHALWYTLILSAIINELNPRVYIHYLLTKVHQLRRGEIDPLTLLPDRIDTSELGAFAAMQMQVARQMLAGFDTS